MPILHLLNFCFLFFIHYSVSASAGNLLTTQTHFEIAAGSISDFLRILISTVKRVLGFGTPYYFANVVIIVITILNIIVYKLLENSDSDQKSSSSSSSNSNLSSEKKLCRFFSLDEIVSATNNFDESLVLGKGGFGKVYKGVIDNGSCIVAIKRLNPLSKQGASEFWAEIKMLSKFRHSHLVSLIGYCDQNKEMILVYEFMVHGSLDNHLHKISKNGQSNILSWVQRLKICIGAARGLDYLHTGTAVIERVIHRDVKSSNILLDDNWAAKISDFGLSRIGPADQEITHVSTKHIQGTYGYMDPEYFYTRRFTRKSDVYAFGVVLLEVLSERPAVDRSLLDEDQWSLAGWGQQCINDGVPHLLVGPNLKWEILETSLMEFVQIAVQCLHNRPNKRPTMTEVVAKLEFALSMQLRTNEPMDNDLLGNDWPFGSPENTVSHANSNQIVQVGDSSSKPETPTVTGNDPVAVRKLLEEDRSLVSAMDYDSRTPLHVASIHGWMDVAKCLIEFGADVNAQDRWKNTPLADAEGAKKEAMIQLLKSHGGLSYGQNGSHFEAKPVPPPLPNKCDWEIDPSELDFTTSTIIGKGSFGEILKASWRGTPVAVKRILPSLSDDRLVIQDFRHEVNLLVKLRHPNIVQFLGAVTERTPLMLITEFLRGGDLHQYLKEKGALNPSTAVNFALDIARGMAYLHNEPNVIVHRDLKPRNVLLVNSNADHLKVGDFGLSKLIRVKNSHDVYKMTGETGSYRYMAPEVFKHRKYDKKVDVFSFAMILYEMLEGDPPMSHYEPYEAARYVSEGHRPTFRHKSYTPELRELTEKCWAPDMNQRPSFLEILKKLEKIKEILPGDHQWNIFNS